MRSGVRPGPSRWRGLIVGLIAAACAVLVAACGSSSNTSNVNETQSSLGTVLYGSLPPQGTPVKGGTITQGQLTGQTPTYIFPIAPGAQTSTGTISFLSELFMPLYAGPSGAEPKVEYSLSAASAPKFSDGNKTVTIPIKPGLKWSNGEPAGGQRRRLLVRPAQGGGQGERRQLGPVHARADARQRQEHLDVGQVQRDHAPDAAPTTRASSSTTTSRTPTTSTRCRARRGTSPQPAGRTSTTPTRPTPRRSTTS